MITDIDSTTVTIEMHENEYKYLHGLNLNFETDKLRYEELKSKAETNNLLNKFGYGKLEF